jgi:TRAP transporter TAXI family solute receptor
VPIDGGPLRALREDYPFLRLTFIPGGSYAGHPHRTPTIGIDSVLVCRADLDDGVVYDLTKALFDILPSISAERASVRDMNIDQAPATSIPLHSGAARYYRERELTR